MGTVTCGWRRRLREVEGVVTEGGRCHGRRRKVEGMRGGASTVGMYALRSLPTTRWILPVAAVALVLVAVVVGCRRLVPGWVVGRAVGRRSGIS